MAIEGPLRELDIHDVFQLLDLGRKTGVLRITSDLRQNAGQVLFERGAVIAAHIQSNPHPIGALLLKSGRIGEGDLAEARALQTAGDPRRLGDILVELGAVTRRELDRVVRQQIEEVIFELMSWSEGYFSFEDGAIDRIVVDAPVHIPTEALLMEAARRIDEWSRIESRVPHMNVVPRLAEGPDVAADGDRALDLVPFEWEVLAAVDGARDLRSVADELGRSEFDVARTAFGLVQAGLITLDDPRRAAPVTAASGDPADLVARAEELLALGDAEAARASAEAAIAASAVDAAAHQALGRALHALRQFDAAEAALQEAVRLEPTLASARRLLGVAQAAQGRFDDARNTWDRWRRLVNLPPDEYAHAPTVERLQQAALALAEAVRGRYE
jgi:hypothetical protein